MSKGKQGEGEARYTELIVDPQPQPGADGIHDKLGLDRRS